MTFRWWDRWGPLTGILAVALWIVGFAVTGRARDTQADATIIAYFAKHSHQVRDIVGLYVFVAGVLAFIAFLAALRGRLIAAEGEPGRLTALAYGAGIASAVLWVASIIFQTAPGTSANVTHRFHLDPNTYRIVANMAYGFWVCAIIVGALLVWATSALALRTGILPRWFAWLGIVVGIINLFAVTFFPVVIYWGWIVVASALLVWRSATQHTPAPTQET